MVSMMEMEGGGREGRKEDNENERKRKEREAQKQNPFAALNPMERKRLA